MKMRAHRKARQEMNGWPITKSWRDGGEWCLGTDGEVRFHRVTSGRFTARVWPRAAWRERA